MILLRRNKVFPLFLASKAYYETLLLQHNTNCQISAARAVYNATMPPQPYDKDDMASPMIAQVKVATDDHDGDGLTGRQDEMVFPPNEDRTRIYALSTTKKRSALTPEILSR
jgi:hypothetical protein